jgi:hypothetical protein
VAEDPVRHGSVYKYDSALTVPYGHPFNDFHLDGLDGLFPGSVAYRIVRTIAAINENGGPSGC